MKLSLACASVLALCVMTGSGFAAVPTTDTAAIKAIDLTAHHLSLADGKMFQLPTSWKLSTFKAGQKVKVYYQDHMGTLTATRIRHSA
jgi:Cu/Ag efflux protein CusF